jgi:hypothetical protein
MVDDQRGERFRGSWKMSDHNQTKLKIWDTDLPGTVTGDFGLKTLQDSCFSEEHHPPDK